MYGFKIWQVSGQRRSQELDLKKRFETLILKKAREKPQKNLIVEEPQFRVFY